MDTTLADILSESLDTEADDVWERERTATPVRTFAVRLHSAGLSLREIAAILELPCVDRSHQAIWQWTHRPADSEPDPPMAAPSRVAIDETAIQIGIQPPAAKSSARRESASGGVKLDSAANPLLSYREYKSDQIGRR